ncbi:MAG: class I SAM-dependent methyltransferase [Nocardioidaceae bacterium]
MSDKPFSEQVTSFAAAFSLEALPDIVDVSAIAPPNPPAAIQIKFVGASYENAYAEAESFVTVCDEFAAKHGRGGFASLDRLLDFGSGWGRITRTLLTRTTARQVHAVDVDQQMTALINTTLPGVNAVTIDPDPPTVFGNATIDAVVAFSVFSHLSGAAHEAWAREIGRLVVPGGVVAITVLDEAFFGQVAGAQGAVRSGQADPFAESLAKTFPDLSAARSGFAAGEIQYAGSGGGEVRTGDYYGWAAAPSAYVRRVWGAAGMRVVEWVPSGVLFPQALVFLVREDKPAGPLTDNSPAAVRGMLKRAVASARSNAARWRNRF